MISYLVIDVIRRKESDNWQDDARSVSNRLILGLSVPACTSCRHRLSITPVFKMSCYACSPTSIQHVQWDSTTIPFIANPIVRRARSIDV